MIKGKKIFSVLMGLILVSCCGLFNACSNGSDFKIDPTKTQLYISNYDGGVGTTWLYEAAARFEEEFADYELNGKTGVEILIDPHRNYGQENVMAANSSFYEIFFNERVQYYDMVASNVALDITDIVTELNSDGKTIESKMTKQQQEFFGYDRSDGVHYYALPHYGAFNGMFYNRDVFNDYFLYFEGDPDNNYRALKDGNYYVFTNEAGVLSAGPDDISGTDDDGLPATFEQFYALMNEMVQVGVTPFTWSGQYFGMYSGWYLEALMADYEGHDQMMLQYVFDSSAINEGETVTADHLVESINDNGITLKEFGEEITPATGYKVYTTAGRYYALKFLEHITSDSNYYSDKVISGAHSHTTAQSDFLRSYYEPGAFARPIGMFFEGGWWFNEVTGYGTVDRLANRGITKDQIRVAYMPWPKVSEEQLGERRTLLSSLNAVGFIKSSIDESKIELAKEFLKFCYTDYELEQFTVNSDTFRALNYSLSSDAYNKLSNVGKSFYKELISDNTDVVYPYSTSPIYISNAGAIDTKETFANASYTNCVRAFMDKEITAENYFQGIVDIHNEASWKQYEDLF